jgi:type II secretory pathway component GspD/PulD (secretin)
MGGGGGALGGSGFGGFGTLDGAMMQGFGGGDGGVHFRSPDTKGVEAMTQHLKHGKAADVAKAIENALPKAKILKVDFEPSSNLIIIIADSASMKEASRIIREVESRGASGGSSSSGGAGASQAGGPGGGAGASQAGGPGGVRSRSSSGSGGEVGRGGVAENRGPVGGLGTLGPGGGGFNPYGTGVPVHVVKLRNAAAQDLATVISRVFPSASITAEPRSNQLIIRADDKTNEEIEKLIGRLDVDGPAPPINR